MSPLTTAAVVRHDGRVLRGIGSGPAGVGRLIVSGVAALLLLNLVVVGVVLLPFAGAGVPVLLGAYRLVRALAAVERRWAGHRLGVEIPEPPDADPSVGPGRSTLFREFGRMVRSRTFRRHLAWLLWQVVAAFVVPLLLLIPVFIAWRVLVDGPGGPVSLVVEAPFALALVAAPLLLAGPVCRGLATVSRWLLAASEHRTSLTHRVEELSRSRTETVEAQEELIRRIEWDLHDGTQAHVVSTGMTIGLARSLIHQDPVRADALLAEAERSVSETLQELRATVRGIRPPVLAERGLADAVRALCLRSRVPAELHIDVPPLDPVVETAVYFALAEAITNLNRHSGARSARLVLAHARGAARAGVTDDGVGGATEGAGSGLPGMHARLGALDGRVDVRSPAGGPTEIRMEVPCEPSSPRISPCSGTGSSGS